MDLRKTLFILPNLLTLSSIFCGFYAIVLLASGAPSDDDFYRASLLIIFAMFFDSLDGRVARMTKTQSAFGVQIDSLADVVSFGVAPALLIYRWALHPLGLLGVIICFAFCACGAIRLARFNVLTMRDKGAPGKPGKYIVGLPIPGAAGLMVSLVVANHVAGGTLMEGKVIIAVVMVLMSFLMVSTVKFRSFKDIRLSWRTIFMVLATIVACSIMAARFRPASVLVFLLAAYITIGLVEATLGIPRSIKGARQRRAARKASAGTVAAEERTGRALADSDH
ncbi:MAG: CDP-diacylglycerol--serine O-phosphatidyltransferase [Deltaproteobacteria bacterium]|nr:CDP-diacylglycerol--serine O-phosphatidyltransferase [Deltaproteobacteria bacterium]